MARFDGYYQAEVVAAHRVTPNMVRVRFGGPELARWVSSGDPDTGKTAGSWFGACVFLIVAATVLRSFFL